jgi:hypothetical protein
MVVTAFPRAQAPSQNIPPRQNSRQMLPGFRFLFAAIMLSISLMVFGLGAAALLRAAHEEFASNPSWRAAPEVMFAQQTETAKPVLAMLQVGLPAAENAQDNSPATDAPAEQAAIAPAPTESEPISALKPEDSSLAATATEETAKAEIPVAESPKAGEATPPQAETAASADQATIATIVTGEVTHAENPAVSTQSGQTAEPVSPADIAATKIATLGGPPVSIETPIPAKAGDAKPDESAIRKQQQEKRAAQQRRMAARAAAQAQLQAAYPFGQLAPAVRTR